MQENRGRRNQFVLDIQREREKSIQIAKALSSPIRMQILEMLSFRSMNVNEMARALDLPLSTTATNVRQLEEANLVIAEIKPGARGPVKLCSLFADDIHFAFSPRHDYASDAITMEMPVGGYSYAHSIQGNCGLAGASSMIGVLNDSDSFYVPQRLQAELIWFNSGFLEYSFARCPARNMRIEYLELTFESCSEAPFYNNHYESDISVFINGSKIGTWQCPGDFGGRRGLNTPSWWTETGTQFGMLKAWRITANGSYLDGDPVSRVTLDMLKLHEGDHISVKIGVDHDAQHVGGINLFGKGFGDYSQDIVLKIGYHDMDHEESGTEPQE